MRLPFFCRNFEMWLKAAYTIHTISMQKKLQSLLFAVGLLPAIHATAQISAENKKYFRDSVIVKAHPVYDKVTHTHRWLFGENFRKEWAQPVKVPVIHLSTVYGGLTPVREGGGMQSKSLRLVDKTGKEWVLRSVEKTPDKLLPPNLRETFAIDWIDDALSAQHPYSALIVPPVAAAVGVPHTNPVIGMVADDPVLGEFKSVFSGILCLLEEREPNGDSDNTLKMEENLVKDNDNRFDKDNFLKARMLDLMLGDWDRHEDQWRWAVTKDKKKKFYLGVPRDRDQVFHVRQGLFPSIAGWSFVDPTLDNFDTSIPRVRYSLFKTRYIQPYPDAQFNYDDYMRVVHEFKNAETDSVLEAGLKLLPIESYRLRHDELYTKFKGRRDAVPAAMEEYFRFINKIVDIRLTDKNDQVKLSDGDNGGLRVTVKKIDKSGDTEQKLMDVTYRPDITEEIRIYLQEGDDRVIVDNHSPIRVRIIGGHGEKEYEAKNSVHSLKLYDKPDSISFKGDASLFRKHLSRDTGNVSFIRTNRYDVWMPLATAALNADDGFLLGAGFRYINQQGFRKLPYTSSQSLMLTHSFATNAFRLKYNGEWIQAVGKADFTLQTYVQAPDNTLNFFGLGNETPLNKMPGYRRFYRTRFDTYQIDPALRFHPDTLSTFSIGPSFQFYHLGFSDNTGRFITQTGQLHSFDSAFVDRDKAHIGLILNYTSNHRNNPILPSKGYYLSVQLQGYKGLNDYSQSFAQATAEFSFYQKLGSNVVLSDRVGGGATVGKPAFYQSMFLGGQGNLLGYLQNRFAGQHMLYNNFQARWKLANIAGYILPGQLGITGFFDTGRVWVNGQHSDVWHTGTGGGAYFSPASLIVVQLLAGHSTEGWYPYFSMNFRI